MGAFLLEVKMNEIEIRTYKAEVRKEGEEKPQIKGQAVVYEKMSPEQYGFKEIIHKRAVGDLIKKNDVFALKNHNEDLILGRNISGTLKLVETDEGLNFVVDPPDTTYSNDLLISMERGDIDKCSFAFRVDQSGQWWEEEDGVDIRHITKFAELYDVSIVTYPFYPQTIAELFGKDVRTPEQVYKEYRNIRQSQEAEKSDEIKAEEAQAQERKEALRQVKLDVVKLRIYEKLLAKGK